MDTKSNVPAATNPFPTPPGGPVVQAARRMGRNVRDRILGGLILILPVLITFWCIRWLYTVLEEKIIDPLAFLVLWKLEWITPGKELPYWFETYVAPVIALVLALVLLYFLDFFADTRISRGFGWI